MKNVDWQIAQIVALRPRPLPEFDKGIRPGSDEERRGHDGIFGSPEGEGT